MEESTYRFQTYALLPRRKSFLTNATAADGYLGQRSFEDHIRCTPPPYVQRLPYVVRPPSRSEDTFFGGLGFFKENFSFHPAPSAGDLRGFYRRKGPSTCFGWSISAKKYIFHSSLGTPARREAPEEKNSKKTLCRETHPPVGGQEVTGRWT